MSSAFHHPCHGARHDTEVLLNFPDWSISRLCAAKMISVGATRSKKLPSQALLKVLTCRICEILLLKATKFWGSLLCINNNSLPSICPHVPLTGMPGLFPSVFSRHLTGGVMGTQQVNLFILYKALPHITSHLSATDTL